MTPKKITGALLFLCLLALLAGCSVTRNLETNQSLLIKNSVKANDRRIVTEELVPYIQQKPNSKLFGLFRTNIMLYNWGSKGKDTKFKKWLRTKMGSEPVLLDTSLNTVSIKQMTMYLANKGFFKSIITDSVVIKRKKATVYYKIHAPQPYMVRAFKYQIGDTALARFVFRDTLKSLILRGEIFDAYKLDDERTRVTSNLQNYGYFRFSNVFIKYRIDTSFRTHQCDVTMEILNRVVPSLDDFATVVQVPHRRYYVNNIYIYPQFDHVVTYSGPYDTLARTFRSPHRGKPDNEYRFLYREPFHVKPRTIAQAIFITPGSHYNLGDVNLTYSQLSNLQVFKYINIRFKEVEEKEGQINRRNDLVDCHVELSRAPAQSFAVSTDATNSGGAFGVQGSLGYTNRNFFRGAEMLRLNLSGSLQMQATGSTSGNQFFNVIEVGVNAGLTFPRFLLPVRSDRIPKNLKPKTSVSIGYNFQHQQHYDRHISNISFGYSWDQSDKIKHTLNPVEISLVKVYTDAYFDSVLNTEQDNRLKNQYTDHMLAGLKYTFTLSNQQVGKVRDFVYLRSNLETGGNLLYVCDELFKAEKTSGGSYTLFGLPYAQYVRPDVDFRYYNVYPNKYSLVFRFYGGIGIPYGNVNVLPFERAFFAGGANGMRGWSMYTLGPGTYNGNNGSVTFSQIGDMQLEGNVEFRFPVYDWIRGAVFVDAGNIWLLQESKDLPGGKFKWPDFLNQFGVDMGLGLRLDFDFFIFRLDPAIKLYAPYYAKGDRWYPPKMQIKDIIWNFGIGYPF